MRDRTARESRIVKNRDESADATRTEARQRRATRV
jgi:hypothetical protein